MSLSSPEIRFKEDNGNEFPDWEEKKLGELGDFKSGVGFSESEQGGKVGTPFYKVSDMNLAGNESSMNSANHYVSDAQISANKYKVIADVSLVFAKVGAAIFLERKRVASNFLIDNNMMAFIPSFDISFAQHLFTTIRLSRFAQVGALPSYNASDLRTIKVPIPHPAEQKKIADFLTSVDERIGQLIKKKALLEDYKKGVMQQLFSQQIRFKDDNGNDFPDWEEKKLGDIGKITTGKTPSTSDDAAWIGDTMFVTPSDIGEDTKFQQKTSRHVNGEKLRLIPKHSLMFTCIASVGKMSIATQPCITNQQINSVSVGSGFLFQYVYYALRNLTPKIKATQANTTLPIINKTEFSKFVLPIPSSHEQKKIADFLSAIDQKIERVSQQITKTQTFKKGLLQQMFV